MRGSLSSPSYLVPWRRAWQPTPIFLPGESPQTEEFGWPQSLGLHQVRARRSPNPGGFPSQGSGGHFFVIPWTVALQAPLSVGILQARILEWVAMPSSRGPPQTWGEPAVPSGASSPGPGAGRVMGPDWQHSVGASFVLSSDPWACALVRLASAENAKCEHLTTDALLVSPVLFRCLLPRGKALVKLWPSEITCCRFLLTEDFWRRA